MSLATANSTIKKVGPGQIYLAPAPTTGITNEEDYYKIFFGSTGTLAAAKKVLTGGILPWATLDNTGLDFKVKPSTVKFDPNNGPAVELVTGIESASAEFTFFEVDPAHLVDLFGSQAADLITVAAATGVAARKIALLGPQSYNTLYSVLYRVASSTVPGEFWHYLFPVASIVSDIEIKMSKKDEMKVKVTLQLQCSPFIYNAAGNGVVVITDDPTSAGL